MRRSGRGRRRGLDDDDLALWAQVARSARPMPGRDARARSDDPAPGPNEPSPDFSLTARKPPEASPAPRIPVDFRVGRSASPSGGSASLPVSPADWLRAQPLRMDHKTHRKMARGKLAPDARIDLHGMTLAVAKTALTSFLLSCSASGHRLVLVITGKGKGDLGPLPTRSGALRHEVPHWLDLPPLSRVVLQVTPAHARHGGGGAYYVYLRRAG